jgi:cell division protein FtsB
MTSTKSYQKLKAKVTAMEQENTRLKGGEVFLQMIADGNSFAYTAPQKEEQQR